MHFLDATLQEEDAISSRLLAFFSCKNSQAVTLQGMRLLGTGEVMLQDIKSLIQVDLAFLCFFAALIENENCRQAKNMPKT